MNITKQETRHLLSTKSDIGSFKFVDLTSHSLSDFGSFFKDHILTFQSNNTYFRTHIFEDKCGALFFDYDNNDNTFIHCDEAIKIKNNLYVNKDIFSNSEAA